MMVNSGDRVSTDRKCSGMIKKIKVYNKKIAKIEEKIEAIKAGEDVSAEDIEEIDEGIGLEDESEPDEEKTEQEKMEEVDTNNDDEESTQQKDHEEEKSTKHKDHEEEDNSSSAEDDYFNR